MGSRLIKRGGHKCQCSTLTRSAASSSSGSMPTGSKKRRRIAIRPDDLIVPL